MARSCAVEDSGLVVLELGRGEALGIDQGLLALVVGGNGLEVGLGDLDVVAEDIVEADFKEPMPVRWRSRSSMAAMDWRAALAEGAQLVELGVDAGAR